MESLKIDIQLLYIHCAIYNQDEAAIVFVASELMNLLLSTVADAEIEFSTEISAKITGPHASGVIDNNTLLKI